MTVPVPGTRYLVPVRYQGNVPGVKCTRYRIEVTVRVDNRGKYGRVDDSQYSAVYADVQVLVPVQVPGTWVFFRVLGTVHGTCWVPGTGTRYPMFAGAEARGADSFRLSLFTSLRKTNTLETVLFAFRCCRGAASTNCPSFPHCRGGYFCSPRGFLVIYHCYVPSSPRRGIEPSFTQDEAGIQRNYAVAVAVLFVHQCIGILNLIHYYIFC